MKCTKCEEGEFEAKGTRFSTRLQKLTRKRVCNKCGYVAKTMEIEIKTYEAENRLINKVIDAINEYSDCIEPIKNSEESGNNLPVSE